MVNTKTVLPFLCTLLVVVNGQVVLLIATRGFMPAIAEHFSGLSALGWVISRQTSVVSHDRRVSTGNVVSGNIWSHSDVVLELSMTMSVFITYGVEKKNKAYLTGIEIQGTASVVDMVNTETVLPFLCTLLVEVDSEVVLLIATRSFMPAIAEYFS